MAKRANGEGNVRQRANGTWEARLSFTDTDTGRGERVSFYGPTAKAVRDKMKAARDRLDAGAPVKDATRTVGDWLTHWRATTSRGSPTARSRRGCCTRTCRRKHLEPAPFGAIPLDRLRPSDVEALVLAMRGQRRCPTRPCGRSTRCCGPALDGAVRDGLLARNPAALVARPGVARARGQALGRRRRDGGAAGRGVVALPPRAGADRGDRVAQGREPGAVVGSRRPRRRDAEGGGDHRRVAGQAGDHRAEDRPARRTVPLSPAVVAMLRRHTTAPEGRAAARPATSGPDSGLVFTTELGGPVDPRNLLRVIEAAAKAAGVDGCRRAHAAAQRGGRLARGRRAYQGGRRSARALARSRSPATCTGTPPTTPRAPRSTGLARMLGL